MKIMILSDSHSVSKTDLLTLLKNNSVNYYIHCGDIYMTYDGINLNSFYLVRGNNDFGNIPDELFITIDDLKFYIVHGHRYDVDYNLDYLTHTAKEKGAYIVCFGHTHRPYYDFHEGITFINPGSVCYPRGQYRNPTYCIFDTKTKKSTFYDVTTLEPCDPFSPMERPKRKEPFYKKWFK